jgi:hypothetical protein
MTDMFIQVLIERASPVTSSTVAVHLLFEEGTNLEIEYPDELMDE